MNDERLEWRAALDAFRAGLGAAERTVRNGAVAETGLWPPPALPSGPPPADLVSEAEALLVQADALAAELAEGMTRATAAARPSRHRPSVAHARWSVTL